VGAWAFKMDPLFPSLCIALTQACTAFPDNR
jgi:hypothetical protein